MNKWLYRIEIDSVNQSYEPKQLRKSWVKPVAAACTIAGVAFYSTTFPHAGGVSITRIAIACGVGAASALVGYGVGTLIDRARK